MPAKKGGYERSQAAFVAQATHYLQLSVRSAEGSEEKNFTPLPQPKGKLLLWAFL